MAGAGTKDKSTPSWKEDSLTGTKAWKDSEEHAKQFRGGIGEFEEGGGLNFNPTKVSIFIVLLVWI
jgi:hypothetical protein